MNCWAVGSLPGDKASQALDQSIIHLTNIRTNLRLGEYCMEDWLATYDAARVSGYKPDYVRQLVVPADDERVAGNRD